MELFVEHVGRLELTAWQGIDRGSAEAVERWLQTGGARDKGFTVNTASGTTNLQRGGG